jgi:gamma-glutamylcyclotransferase (GGCT)/AIG2-like uncharacterized protein YtfP
MAGTALFVYGTLTDPAVCEAVTGHRFPTRPARLRGYARLAPAGSYPYVVPRRGASVEGLLLDGVDAASLRALDAYEVEGRLYRRTAATAEADGTRVACEVYVAIAGAHPVRAR